VTRKDLRILVVLGVVFVALVVTMAVAAVAGDTSLLIVATVCSVPVGFLISMLMQKYRPA
jgi:hypothetical protein